jgi:hypothetical protein
MKTAICLALCLAVTGAFAEEAPDVVACKNLTERVVTLLRLAKTAEARALQPSLEACTVVLKRALKEETDKFNEYLNRQGLPPMLPPVGTK